MTDTTSAPASRSRTRSSTKSADGADADGDRGERAARFRDLEVGQLGRRRLAGLELALDGRQRVEVLAIGVARVDAVRQVIHGVDYRMTDGRDVGPTVPSCTHAVPGAYPPWSTYRCQ